MVQPGVGLEIDVGCRQKSEHQHQRAHPHRCPRQPGPTRAQMNSGEPDHGHEQYPQRHLRPPHHRAILLDRLRVHQQQFARRDRRRSDGAAGKQQMPPRAARLEPDKQMNPRQREAHGGVHGPDDRDPAHSAVTVIKPASPSLWQPPRRERMMSDLIGSPASNDLSGNGASRVRRLPVRTDIVTVPHSLRSSCGKSAKGARSTSESREQTSMPPAHTQTKRGSDHNARLNRFVDCRCCQQANASVTTPMAIINKPSVRAPRMSEG